MSNIVFQAGNHSAPTAVSGPRYEEPLLPDYNGILVLRQDYEQNLPVVAENLNTTYPGDGITPAQTDYYLVDEGPREDVGGYTVRWTRTWARIPNAHYKPGGIYYYNYPGLASIDRDPTAQIAVWATIYREFYLVGTGGSYATFEALVSAKLRKSQKYLGAGGANDILTGDNMVLDSTTNPTEAAYVDLIDNNETIVAEDSKIYRWMGNIFAVDTIYIPAR